MYFYKFLRFPGGKPKAVTLSYDDGWKADLRFSDVITEKGMKCTFNLCSFKRINRLTKEEVKEYFLDRGHEIAVHCANHRAPGTLRSIEGIREVLDCRLELEETFDTIIRGMAYPDCGITLMENGATYENIKSYLSDLDIAYARTLGKDNTTFNLPEDWHAWMPSVHNTNPEVLDYIDKFLAIDISHKAYAARRNPRLFYMWGHTTEFESNNGWELLDKITDKLAGHDDIWYATNMEIYEYVNAYNSLIYSADGQTVYNPTLFEIWFDTFDTDAHLHCIKPGETLKL
jgi:peptidoglycan/xylan/chitin deacetylase (PgdA/CDA1 family)